MPSKSPPALRKGLWTSPRAIALHLSLLVVAPGCLYAAWWQANRALSGNALSYVYSIEWPVFAGYAVFMWWKILHEPPQTAATTLQPKVEPLPLNDPPRFELSGGEDDAALAEYNRYLAGLATRGDRKTWRGGTLPTTARGPELR